MREVMSWAWIGIRNVMPYLVLMVILGSVYFYKGSITECKERDIRWIGLIFQIIGFVLVARQLTGIRTLLRKPSIASRVANYIKSLPYPFVKTVSLEAHVGAGSPTAEARLRVRPDPNSSLERRLEIMETAVKNMEEDLQNVRQDLGSLRTENNESLEELRQETTEKVEKVRKLIDDAVVGGIHLEWVGTICFLIGAVLATTAPELTAWLGYQRRCG